MMRKRYKEIEGDYIKKNDRINRPCKKRGYGGSFGAIPGSNVCHSIYQTIRYKDRVRGDGFTVRKWGKGWKKGESWQDGINVVRDLTVNMLWKEVVLKVNKFFTPEICLQKLGCKCPPPIQKKEITFSWPQSCFGNIYQCQHPAYKFGKNYYWCYTAKSSDSWIKCGRIDFDTCMPVRVDPVEPLNILDLD